MIVLSELAKLTAPACHRGSKAMEYPLVSEAAFAGNPLLDDGTVSTKGKWRTPPN
jgi:hypothetical protein